jgi:hypothetical protein
VARGAGGLIGRTGNALITIEAVVSGEDEASRVRLYQSANLLSNGTPSPDQQLDPFGAVLANGVFVG